MSMARIGVEGHVGHNADIWHGGFNGAAGLAYQIVGIESLAAVGIAFGRVGKGK